MMHINSKTLDEISELCKTNKVKSLFGLGSVTRKDFNDNSDIDLITDFMEDDPFKYTDLYFLVKYNLELILKKKIDLLEERAIRNKYFRRIVEDTKVKIYG